MKTPFLLTAFLSALLGGGVAIAWLQSTPAAVATEPAIQSVNWSPPPSAEARAMRPATATDRAMGDTHFRKAASAALDAVVHIRTARRVVENRGWNAWMGGAPSERIQQGSGSGVILSEEGLIVTNHHVIDGADEIVVGLNDNRSVPAELVGSDPATDIAVLRIESDGLVALPWGNSDDVYVGDWVLAVGNPFDLTSTVTAGIVSAKARDIRLLRGDASRDVFPIESFIQTDAAVNPGNSGGALVDTEGRLVGINTAIASRTGSYAGYSFAVPANLARKVAEDIMATGRVQRAYLGVTIRPVTESLASDLSLPTVEGVLITGMTDFGGAAEAGLAEGDVILAVNGQSTPTLPVLLEKVNAHRPGDAVDVLIWRDGERLAVPVELRSREGSLAATGPRATDGAADSRTTTILGAVFSPGTEVEGALLLDSGGGPMARIQPGTTITAVDGERVAEPASLARRVADARASERSGLLLEGVTPGGETVWFGVGLP